jgi:hypothetical protein
VSWLRTPSSAASGSLPTTSAQRSKSFYADAGTVMRNVATETERTDREASSGFSELERGRPHLVPPRDEAGRGVTTEPERGAGASLRQSRLRKLSPVETNQLRSEFESIGGDPAILRFNKGPRTSYRDEVDLIYVRGDVLPTTDPAAIEVNATLSSRAALAHELGHRQFRGTKLEPGDVKDEIRASVWAAKNVTQLSDKERIDLLRDAHHRARGDGQSAVMQNLGSMLRQPVIKWQGWAIDLPWWNA